MANGLQLPFQATSRGPGHGFTITSNVEIQDDQTVAAIPGINTGPVKVILALLVVILVSISFTAAFAADVQVNSVDNNATNLGNFTTESETYIARFGSLIVVGYNTSRQAGLLGSGAWTSLSGYAYSTNEGASFTDAGFVPSTSTYVLEGDPTLGFDRSGNLYYASLMEDNAASGSYIGVSKSTSPSVTFGAPVAIAGQYSTSGGFEDKEFLAIAGRDSSSNQTARRPELL